MHQPHFQVHDLTNHCHIQAWPNCMPDAYQARSEVQKNQWVQSVESKGSTNLEVVCLINKQLGTSSE